MEISSDVICQFLEAAMHHVLWKRCLYPEAIFVSRLAFSVPIKVSIHPDVNSYISKSLTCFRDLLCKSQITVQGIDFVVLDENEEIFEKYIFQMNRIYCIQNTKKMADEELNLYEIPESVNNIFRNCLLKLTTRLSDLPILENPENCSFNIQIHVSKNGEDYLEQNHIEVPWIKKENEILPLILNKVTSTIPVFKEQDPFELEVYVDLISPKP